MEFDIKQYKVIVGAVISATITFILILLKNNMKQKVFIGPNKISTCFVIL